MRPIAITRQSSILFFGREGTMNPVASVQVAIMGECAFLYSLMGPGFYEHLAEHGLVEFEKLGLHYMYAAVSDAHLRLMRRKLKLAQVTYLFKNRTAGHLLNWVLITGKAPESDKPHRPEGGTLRKIDMYASDAAIEKEIQAKGLTAPRVTDDNLKANIAEIEIVKHISKSGQVLRWAVLTTRNGYAVVGRPSVSVSPENDDVEIGEKIAVGNAINELWPLMGYALKEKLAVAA